MKRKGLHAWLADRRGEVVVLLLSSVWVMLLTYPLITHLNSSMYAYSWNTDNPGGGWVVGVWSTWWTKQAWATGVDWRIVPIIGAPFGVDWRSAPYQYLSVYLTTGLAWLTGELVAHNLLILASFPLSALTTYWLCRYLTHSRRAALVGGLIFAFSTYHWARASVHFNMAMIQWVPLYLLALFRWGDRPSLGRGAAAGAAFALVFLDNYYYGYFMVFATGAFLLGRGLWSTIVDRTWRVSRERLASGMVALMSAVLISAPFVWPVVTGVLDSRSGSVAPAWMFDRSVISAYGAQAWMYLVPSYMHPLWRPWLADFYRNNFRLNEQALYLGLIALGLGTLGWLRSRHRNRERDKVTLAIILAVMLWTSGPPLISIGSLTLPTPSYFLADTLPMFRVHARMGGLATAGVAALAAYGVSWLVARWPSRRNTLTILAAGAVLFDALHVPPVNNLDLSQTPPEYEWLAAQPGDFIVAEYPLFPADAYARMARYLFYQRVHQKRLFNGVTPGSEGDRIRQQILDVIDPRVPGMLRDLGVRYVLIHTDRYEDAGAVGVADGPAPTPEQMPPGLNLVVRFESTLVYGVEADSR